MRVETRRTLLPAVVFLVLALALALFWARPVGGAEWVVPPGTKTDCGTGFTLYAIRPEFNCTGNDYDCWKLRYGPEFPRSSGAKCQQSELDNVAGECFEITYGRTATKQDRLDLGLSVAPWLGQAVHRQCCTDCDPLHPIILTKNDQKAYFRGQACRGFGESRRADNLPCGRVVGYSCSFQWPAYFENRAPNCLGSGPPPPDPLCGNKAPDPGETCLTCPQDLGACPPPVTPPAATSPAEAAAWLERLALLACVNLAPNDGVSSVACPALRSALAAEPWRPAVGFTFLRWRKLAREMTPRSYCLEIAGQAPKTVEVSGERGSFAVPAAGVVREGRCP